MKIPTNAIVEFRCNCGSLIGYVERVPGQHIAVLKEGVGGLNVKRVGRLVLPADMTDLRAYGSIARCGNDHARLIVGDDWKIPAKPPRRKVIISRHAEDAPDKRRDH